MRVLISGSYGTGNVGDEVILEGVLRALSGHEVSVLSKNATYTRTHFDVSVISEAPPLSILSVLKDLGKFRLRNIARRVRFIGAMLRTDVFLMGGGGLIAELLPTVLTFHLSQLRLAKRLRKKVVLFAVGVGPLRTPGGIALTKATLNSCVDFISVRDGHSKSLLEKIGVTRPIHLLPDPAVHYRIPVAATRKRVIFNFYKTFVDERVFPGQKYRFEKLKSSLLEITKYLLEKHDYEVRFLTFGTLGEFEFADELCALINDPRCTVSPYHEDFHVTARELGTAHFIIAMRLHACLIAMVNGVPSICIDQQFKTERVLDEIGLRELLLELPDGYHKQGNSDLEMADVITKLNYVHANHDAIRSKLLSYFDQQRACYDVELSKLKSALHL